VIERFVGSVNPVKMITAQNIRLGKLIPMRPCPIPRVLMSQNVTSEVSIRIYVFRLWDKK
jgi:hypothetical protein